MSSQADRCSVRRTWAPEAGPASHTVGRGKGRRQSSGAHPAPSMSCAFPPWSHCAWRALSLLPRFAVMAARFGEGKWWGCEFVQCQRPAASPAAGGCASVLVHCRDCPLWGTGHLLVVRGAVLGPRTQDDGRGPGRGWFGYPELGVWQLGCWRGEELGLPGALSWCCDWTEVHTALSVLG